MPTQIYPLFENGFRHHRGQSVQANNFESAKLYAEFAHIAERLKMAKTYGQKALSEKEIGTVTKKNRLISFPCKRRELRMAIVG